MKRYIAIFTMFFALFGSDLGAQQNPGRNQKKRQNIKVSSQVVDTSGNPLAGVSVTGNEGRLKVFTAADGSFKMTVPVNSYLLFESVGYEDNAVEIRGTLGGSVVMREAQLFSGGNDLIALPNGFSATRRGFTGSSATIGGANLIPYPDLSIENALAGQLPGLTVLQQPGGLGRNTPELLVRGYGSLSGHAPAVIVDGIERSMDGLIAEEIESVTVLRDATAKILYGPRAANGVILVKTKRGERFKRIIRVNTDAGVMLASSMPEFLGAADYMRLYDEARANDGLSPYYSAGRIAAYGDGSGPNSLHTPDVDYYDYFLKKAAMYRKLSLEFLGGNQNVRYALIAGYTGGHGLEKMGKNSVLDRFNVRSNLDVRITESLSASLDVSGRIELYNGGYVGVNDIFDALSSHRPNEYPILLQGAEIDHAFYGDEILGGSFLHPENLYGAMRYGGYTTDRIYSGQTNLGFDLDMKKLIKGLRANAYATMDNYNYLSKGQNLHRATYAPVWSSDADGNTNFELVQLTERKYQGDVDIFGSRNNSNIGFYGGLSYGRTWCEHSLDAGVSYGFFRKETDGNSQDIKNSNLVARAAYAFRDIYYIELDAAMMGSGRFERGNRYAVFPAAGIGWVVSSERWFGANPNVNFLKLRASAGVIGYDATTPYYLYERRWSNKGDIGFGSPNDDNSVSTVGASWDGAKDLKWEKSREINLGVDALFFRNRFSATLDLFHNYRYDIIMQVRSNFPTLAGHMIPYQNWGEVSSRGFEADLRWGDRSGDFSYTAGVWVSWSESKVERTDEVGYDPQNSHAAKTGKAVDAIFGYRSLGLFGADFTAGGYPVQTLGAYGAGDVRYRDLNGDGVIDAFDRMAISNSIPRTVVGLNVDFNWKGFGVYMLGTAHLGVDKMLSNTYYWNYGDTKYSVRALDRWHPQKNPAGSYPRLTTTNGTNNYTDSDFWIEDGGFFRLKNVEISYTYENKRVPSVVGKAKFYLRGTNLWTVSRIGDLDPEVLDGGLTSYPVFTTLTAGVSLTF